MVWEMQDTGNIQLFTKEFMQTCGVFKWDWHAVLESHGFCNRHTLISVIGIL